MTKVPKDARRLINIFQKVDRGVSWQDLGDDRLTAQMLMNRGFIENEPVGPNFGQVRPRLTAKAQQFRRFY